MPESLHVGDRMRWSADLLREVLSRADPDGFDVMTVIVVDISTGEDGTKLVKMARTEPGMSRERMANPQAGTPSSHPAPPCSVARWDLNPLFCRG